MAIVIGILLMFLVMISVYIYGISPVVIKQSDDSRRIDPLPKIKESEEISK